MVAQLGKDGIFDKMIAEIEGQKLNSIGING
jgi:hypothetical protein